MQTNKKSCLTMCSLCDGGCFARVTVEDNRIKEVAPPAAGDAAQGTLCVKGAALKTYVHAPERIDRPMRRVGEKGSGQFEPITWEEAFEEIAFRLNRVKAQSGAAATAFFAGHPKWFRYALAELAAEYGSPNFLTESSTCHTAPEMASLLTFGCSLKNADARNCKTLVCWGGDTAHSMKGVVGAQFAVKKRGGTLIVVDPRKTPITERADIHLAIRPGTDGALALAMANVILTNGWEDKEFLAQYAEGLDEFKEIADRMTPQRAAEICGVEADLIIQAAQCYATNGPAGIFTTSCGIAHSPNSVQNLRAVLLLEALTGNWNREGGNRAFHGWMLNGFHHAARDRVDVEHEQNGAYPVWNELIPNEGQSMGLDKAILEGRVRNVIAFGMNSRMFPRADRMRQALLASEFFVDVEVYMTDAAKCADLILPCTTGPEREYVHKLPDDRVIYLPAALDPGERRNDIEIIQGICAALGLNGWMTGQRTFDEYLNWMLEPAGVTLEEVKACPEGVPARREKAGKPHDGFVLQTPSGKVEFKSSVLEKHGFAPLPDYEEYLEENPDPERFPLILCAGGRKAWVFQSRTYHLPWLAGLDPHPTATMSPAEAEKRGIVDGDAVRVTTPIGSRVLTAQVSANVQDGQIFAQHDDAVNVNDIIDSDYCDPISGFPGFRTYFCQVEKEVGACE